jgi:hypothetical protein
MSTIILTLLLSADPSSSGKEFYLSKVKPLLSTKCVACHGSLKQEGELRLDTAGAARAGGESGPALVAHDVAKSLLLERVKSTDADLRMPPAESGPPLRGEEIEILSSWIQAGGAGPEDESPDVEPSEHWAFRPAERATIPATIGDPWPEGYVDAFIRSEQKKINVEPQPDASASIWLRRVSLDLIGLPPSFSETIAFESDNRLDAKERTVDRLLASPAYGERWGRHWMDIWRYSDWWGLGADVRNSQKHIWHWRDWIVESLNANVGYDEMVRQMLAADELYPNEPDKLRATGFLVRHYFKFNRNTWMEETIEHTSKAFLGLTMNCARCHDHKYDPWTQNDYYQFRAFFEPYQVRTDQVPGELDYEKDGIPRVYDAHLYAPTYFLTQGDEARAVKDKIMSPAVPALLSRFSSSPSITAKPLPDEAFSTGRRPWVIENHRQGAQRKRESAQAAYELARQQVERWMKATDPAKELLITQDSFDSLSDDRWKQVSGHWEIVDRSLRQTATSPGISSMVSSVPLTGDFELNLRLTIHGGEKWKSAGFAFDVTDQRRIGVYLSALSDGSKLQVYYRADGKDHYPAEGGSPRTVSLDRPISLTARVRGSHVHVLVDGAHALSYRVPIERKSGTWELFTYDAQASFDDIRATALPEEIDLPEPGATPSVVSLDEALERREIANAAVASAQREQASIEARWLAMLPDADDSRKRNAATAEMEHRVAEAEHQWLLVRHQSRLLTEKERRTKLEPLLREIDQAREKLREPGFSFTPIRGSIKAPESNQESPESLALPFPPQTSGRRSALARWMTDPAHPTFARVGVNHVWARHMGQPLVKTVIDFGLKGARPTHPELLDTLTREWIDQGFEMKSLHRDIVTSHTYRLSSSMLGTSEQARLNDPTNQRYWRMPDRRMEAEVLRDTLLFLGGQLDRRMHGPNVNPVEMPMSSRRSLYFTHSHNERHRFLEVFDSASTRECYVRASSIIPQQSLALVNSQLTIESARHIASTIGEMREDEFIATAWLTILGTRPSTEEQQACREAMASWVATGSPASARWRLVQSLINQNDFISIR